jgi:HSP20 family protein
MRSPIWMVITESSGSELRSYGDARRTARPLKAGSAALFFRHRSDQRCTLSRREIMLVTHYSPWLVRGNAQAKQALDRFFNTTDTESSAWTPRVDVREEASRFVILADLPGVDPTAIEIQMDKNVLSLKGERKSEIKEEGAKLTRVAESANADGISAVGKNGVLEISIPKKPESAPRRIAIHS